MRSRWSIVLAALVATIPMWLSVPLAAWSSGIEISVRADWPGILLRVILVNGIAEEVIHRGLIFRYVRRNRSFIRAAAIAAVIFAAQHLYSIGALGLIPGLAAVVLACFVAFPLAFAFEAGGNSIVAPAILHVGSNLPIQIFVTRDGPLAAMAVPYMGIVLLSMYSVLITGTLFAGVESNGHGGPQSTEGTGSQQWHSHHQHP